MQVCYVTPGISYSYVRHTFSVHLSFALDKFREAYLNFSAQFIKIISHYNKMCYNNNVLQQTACLVVNPITVRNFVFLFNCMLVGRILDSMMVQT